MPSSNYFYPVFDHTEFVQEFGQVPEYTRQQLQEASRLAEADDNTQKIERIAIKVARAAPAFDPKLVRQLLTLHPPTAEEMAANKNLDPESAQTIENYARQCLTDLPVPETEQEIIHMEAEVLSQAAAVLGHLHQQGHEWSNQTRKILIRELKEQGEAGQRMYNPRVKWAGVALLHQTHLSAAKIEEIWQTAGGKLGQAGLKFLATHPNTPTELVVELIEEHPESVCRPVLKQDHLRDIPEVRDALIGKADQEALVKLLKDNRPEEFERIIRALFEDSIHKGFQILERPRFKAMAEGMLSPKALMPAIRHDNSEIRERAMRMLSHLEEDGQIEERFQEELEKRGLLR